MSNDPLYQKMRETGWRRKLDAEEEARLSQWLAAHPGAQADWDSETALNELLASLPDVPVASNFTARVLAGARHEIPNDHPDTDRVSRFTGWWTKWVLKAALAAVILTVGLISYSHVQSMRRAKWAQSLAAVAQVEPLPSPDVLNDFDTIAALSSTPPADEELLSIMQ